VARAPKRMGGGGGGAEQSARAPMPAKPKPVTPKKDDPLDFNISDEELLESALDEGFRSDNEEENKIEKKNSPTPNDSKPAAKKFRTGAVDTNVMQVNFTVGNHGEFVTKKPVRCPECDAVVA
jgi:hypothetical protein